MNLSQQPSTAPGAVAANQSYRGSFAVMTSLFFLWGFMTVFNDILIPRFKDAFTLNYFEAMLVQFAFFGAYFVGSLLYFLISASTGDPIARMGYKRGVIVGLLISGCGAGLFWPAATMLSYALFLIALFIVGLGFAMLQIAANPYVTILGPERTASSRLNLAQGFNSLGTTTGPLIGGYLIFQYFAHTGAHGAESVKVPYLAFFVIFVLLAVVFGFIHLPDIGGGHIEPGAGALRFPYVMLGVIAIFMYVGGEVSVGSAIINFLGQKSVAGLTPVEASQYVSLFWGGMLIGRFMAAIELSEMKAGAKQALLLAIPVAAFLVLLGVKAAQLRPDGAAWYAVGDWSLAGAWAFGRAYLPFLVLCWLFSQFARGSASRTLLLFSVMCSALLAVAIFSGGRLAMWCVVGVGLFTSIGFPNIFSLAIDGLGKLKSQASSLLVMAILGGAILPPIQGFIADHTELQYSFIVPLIAYAYVAFYGAKGCRIGKPEAAESVPA